MNKYELVYVIDTTLDDDARKAVMDRFHGMLESLGGKVEKVEEEINILQPQQDKYQTLQKLVSKQKKKI